MRVNYKAIDAITSLGLASGLKLCLDAGDAASYASGQKWLDLSGGGYDFNRGATSGAEASDPTFNGTPGNFSSAEYWGFDGGDFFTYDSANETWMQNLHKDGAKLTLACWIYTPASLGTQFGIAGNNNAGTGFVGFQFNIRPTNVLRFGVTNASGAAALNMDSTATIGASAWTFLAVSLDEAVANSGIMQVGATQETGKACAYSSPSAAGAAETMQIGRMGALSSALMPSGSRMAMLWAWEGVALTAGQLMDLHNITRYTFGV